MSGLFSKPKSPKVVMPAAPTESDAATQAAMDEAAREQAARLARGRSATLLTGGAGLTNLGKTSKVLLGQ